MSACYTAYNCTRRRKRNNSRRASTHRAPGPCAPGPSCSWVLSDSSASPGDFDETDDGCPLDTHTLYSCAGSDCAIAAPARGGGPPGAALQAASAVAARGAAAAEKAAGGALVGGTLVGTRVGPGEAAAGAGLE